ncbi:MAG TPA: protease pro-enzyme activation domain-containing protein, partial [Steroidobacteraceae bacterium]
MTEFARMGVSGARKISLICPLLVAAAAYTLAGGAATAATTDALTTPLVKDLGVVGPTTPMSAIVWLRGKNEAGLTAAVEELNDPSSPHYHKWMSADELAAYSTDAQDVTTARGSLTSMGLSVDHISADGAMIKVSGSAAVLEAAFGTKLHQLRADGRAFYKATSAPKYQGANAELVTAVSGLTGPGAQPFIAYQTDLATGARVAPLSPQAGTDPL